MPTFDRTILFTEEFGAPSFTLPSSGTYDRGTDPTYGTLRYYNRKSYTVDNSDLASLKYTSGSSDGNFLGVGFGQRYLGASTNLPGYFQIPVVPGQGFGMRVRMTSYGWPDMRMLFRSYKPNTSLEDVYVDFYRGLSLFAEPTFYFVPNKSNPPQAQEFEIIWDGKSLAWVLADGVPAYVSVLEPTYSLAGRHWNQFIVEPGYGSYTSGIDKIELFSVNVIYDTEGGFIPPQHTKLIKSSNFRKEWGIIGSYGVDSPSITFPPPSATPSSDPVYALIQQGYLDWTSVNGLTTTGSDGYMYVWRNNQWVPLFYVGIPPG